MDHKPGQVPSRASTVGQTSPTQWRWVEPGVWTERMLEALERGVKGGFFFRNAGLFSLVAARRAIIQSLRGG